MRISRILNCVRLQTNSNNVIRIIKSYYFSDFCSIANADIKEWGNNMRVDIEEIRKDLLENSYGAFYIGGFGGAMVEAQDIKRMSPDEIISLAKEQGLNLEKYQY